MVMTMVRRSRALLGCGQFKEQEHVKNAPSVTVVFLCGPEPSYAGLSPGNVTFQQGRKQVGDAFSSRV